MESSTIDNENELIRLDEISIRSVFVDLIKNAWVMILMAVSAVFLVSGYFSLVFVPEYTSSATLVVSARGAGANEAYANLFTATEMAEVFQDVFQGNVLKKLVRDNLSTDVGDFSITANVVSETNLLVVSVTAESPELAYRIILETMEHYSEVSDYVFENAVLSVLQEPRVPTSPSNHISKRRYQKYGALAAAFLAAAAIAVFSILRGTVKTEAAARNRLNGKVLALLGHEKKNRTLKSKLKKKNKAILITSPLVSFGYAETFQKLAFRIQYEMQKKEQKILLVSSVAENEGKSTVAANIAIALAQMGKKVILVDFDLRRPALYKIFESRAKKTEEFWRETLKLQGSQELQLMMKNKPTDNPVRFMNQKDLASMIRALREEFDFVVLDSSPMNVAADAEILMKYAEAGLLVVRQDLVWAQEINYYTERLEESELSFLGYVLNNFENSIPFVSRQYNYGYGKKYGRYGYGDY